MNAVEKQGAAKSGRSVVSRAAQQALFQIDCVPAKKREVDQPIQSLWDTIAGDGRMPIAVMHMDRRNYSHTQLKIFDVPEKLLRTRIAA